MTRLKCNRKGWEQLKKRLQRFDERQIDVGFFKKEKYGADNDNMYVAEVARMNEYGTSTNPPRPFMRVDFVSYVDKTFEIQAKTIFRKLLFDKRSSFIKDLEEIASAYSNTLKQIIYDYPGRNSAEWAGIKGFNDPLYHTGTMVEAVNHRIVKRSR